ncbi:hypothetical protein LZ30DRAFT_684143 [Colletotrichum cereale]|nr:hypothetical protein LZ30DRAFT_684143 [Colletotrichum cereale]
MNFACTPGGTGQQHAPAALDIDKARSDTVASAPAAAVEEAAEDYRCSMGSGIGLQMNYLMSRQYARLLCETRKSLAEITRAVSQPVNRGSELCVAGGQCSRDETCQRALLAPLASDPSPAPLDDLPETPPPLNNGSDTIQETQPSATRRDGGKEKKELHVPPATTAVPFAATKPGTPLQIIRLSKSPQCIRTPGKKA